MSGQLNLIHIRPDLRRLLPWAQRYRLLPERGQGDLGYALHAALTAVWAEQVPQPFSYDGSQGLLAYSKQPAEELHAAAALATPELALMLGLDGRDDGHAGAVRQGPARPHPRARCEPIAGSGRLVPMARPAALARMRSGWLSDAGHGAEGTR